LMKYFIFSTLHLAIASGSDPAALIF